MLQGGILWNCHKIIQKDNYELCINFDCHSLKLTWVLKKTHVCLKFNNLNFKYLKLITISQQNVNFFTHD